MPKLQPAVMTLNFTGDGYIDLSQCASIVNRRFYRQGLQWAVAGFTVELDNQVTSGNIRIETLPTTWVVSGAWHKIFAHWRKQQSEALEASGADDVRAKFNDFKIFMDTPHVTAGVSGNLLPTYGDGSSQFTVGEWEPSQVVIPNSTADASGSEVDPTEFLLHMVGAGTTANSLGMIEGYKNSRALPISPDPQIPTNTNNVSNWLRNMFDVGNEDTEVMANASERNNETPYPHENYPGGGFQAPGLQLHSAFKATGSNVIANRFTIPGCIVPCGLIKFSNDTGVNARLQVHLTPGNHRGYLAEPMQDM